MSTACVTPVFDVLKLGRRIIPILIGALASLPLIAGGAAANTVLFGTPSGPVSPSVCATVDVNLVRSSSIAARAVSVTIQLSPELVLCAASPPSSITQGSWASAYSSFFYVNDLGGGKYQVDQSVLGSPCGPTGNGTLFTIEVKQGVSGSSGTISFTTPAPQMTDCPGASLPLSNGGSATVSIGTTPPGPVTGLNITQVKSGNDNDGTIKTRFDFSLPAGATAAEIYCAPYGNYPEYDDLPGGSGIRKINFQTSTAATPAGYEEDEGLPYDAVRGYGWLSGPLSTTARNSAPADPRDTFAYVYNDDPPGVWEVQVGSGLRQVRVLCGDSFTQGRHQVTIEGVVFLDNVLTNGAQYAQVTKTVNVGGDGLLTMTVGGANVNAPPLSHTKVCFIEISGVPGGTPGQVPPAVTGYPPPSPYVYVASATSSPYYYEVSTRDYYYYVLYAVDGSGNRSVPTSFSHGVLNYALCDIFRATTTPFVQCAGDNACDIQDLSFFGSNYNRAVPSGDPSACVDIGPLSTSAPTLGLPVTDDYIDFEDLNVFALCYGDVSKVGESASLAASSVLSLVPVDLETNGALRADLHLQGAGDIRAVSVQLGWDPLVVEPVGAKAGELLEAQGGIALEAGAGGVDFALLGARSVGFAGEGVVASLRFRRIGSGDPGLAILAHDARDLVGNKTELAVAGGAFGTAAAPRATGILGSVPNPFNPSTRVSFVLSRSGRARVSIYSLNGRLVRNLVDESMSAGLHDVSWNGVNGAGRPVASGVYYAHLVFEDRTWSHPVVLVK